MPRLSVRPMRRAPIVGQDDAEGRYCRIAAGICASVRAESTICTPVVWPSATWPGGRRTEAPLNTPRHFSMIRGFHLADFFTLANAACGVAAVFCAMIYATRESVPHFLAAA